MFRPARTARTAKTTLVLLAICGCSPASEVGEAERTAKSRLGANMEWLGHIDGMTEPLQGVFVSAFDEDGQRIGRAITDVLGDYESTLDFLPARIVVHAHSYVPRFVDDPDLVFLAPDRVRFDLDVGPHLGGDGSAENTTFMVLRSDGDSVVPHVAWGNGGGVGSPQDELADLAQVGSRYASLASLVPKGTRLVPNIEAGVRRQSTPQGDYWEARFSEELNDYNLGAAGTQALIDQIVATTSIPGSDEELPVQILVRCSSCNDGYEPLRDGHVGPTGPGASYPLSTPRPSDAYSDIADHRYRDHIAMAKTLEIALAYPDGSFRPDQAVTRAHFVIMLLRTLKLPRITPAVASFSDVASGDWYYKAIETAVSYGLISGFPDGTFRPSAPVTRGQLAAYLVNAAGWPIVTNPIGPSFSDVPPWYWAYAKIETAYGWCHTVDVRSWETNEFAPALPATRAEVVAGLMRMMNCFTGDEITP